MTRFRRQGRQWTLRLAEYEFTLLKSLAEQLIGLLEADELPPPEDDPLAAWEAEMKGSQLDPTDPVIARLFPPAYRDDPAAQADFRRYTENAQRRAKIDQAGIVLAAMAVADPQERRVDIAPEEVEAWLKTVAAIRLSLAVRLGIERAEDLEGFEELSEDDPRTFIYSVYEWLGYFLETLLSRL